MKLQHKKKDGPNHPFLPNLTYSYEKNLCVYFLYKTMQQR